MLRNKLYRYGDDSVKIPAHTHLGKDLLERIVDQQDRVAVVTARNGESITYSELAQKSIDIALSLTHMGVKKGDVVAVCTENRVENMLVMPVVIGAICAGAVFTPVPKDYGSAAPFELRMQIVKPKVIFISQHMYKMYKKALASIECIEKYIIFDDVSGNQNDDQNDDINRNAEHTKQGNQKHDTRLDVRANEDIYANQDGFQNLEGREDDDAISFKEFLTQTGKFEDFIPTPVEGWKDFAIIMFTTGSTGLPKAVPLTHLGLLLNCVTRTKESFKHLSVLISPERHVNVFLKYAIKCLWRGMTCIFSDMEREQEYFRAIVKYKVKILYLLPLHIKALLNLPTLQQYDLSSVEIIHTGAMTLEKKVVATAKKRLPNLQHVYLSYGTTETRNICNNLHAPLGPRYGSGGVALHGYVIKVVDLETGKAVGPYQRGEIRCTTKTLSPGYIGVDDVLKLDEEGFFKTGDFGYYDDDGYFYQLGRIENLIKSGDTLIAPQEIEMMLCEMDYVADAGVASVNGALAAAVVLEDGVTISADQLKNYLHSKIPASMDGGIHFVKKIPRTGPATFKLDRRAIAAMLADIMRKKN